MLKLLIEETHAANPVLPVSWCISEDVKEKFKEEEVALAYLLIIAMVTPPDNLKHGYEIQETERILVPLSQGLAYLHFSRSGEHLIYAGIVIPYDSKNGYRHLKEHFFSRDNGGRYPLSVFRPELSKKDLLRGFLLHYDLPGKATDHAIEMVTVSEKFFATEPSKWEKDWVLYFPRALNIPILNQCHYRAWRIVAYTLQPLWFFVRYVIVGLCVLLLLSLGFVRKVKVRQSLFLASIEPFFSLNVQSQNIFLTNKEGEDRSPIWFCFAPLWLFLVTISSYGLFVHRMDFASGKFNLPLSLSIGFSVSLLLGFVLLVLAALQKWLNKITDEIIEREMHRKDKRESLEKELMQELTRRKKVDLQIEKEKKKKEKQVAEMINNLEETVVCEHRSTPLKVSDLPLTSRTIVLHAESIKAKVCKQFARQ